MMISFLIVNSMNQTLQGKFIIYLMCKQRTFMIVYMQNWP